MILVFTSSFHWQTLTELLLCTRQYAGCWDFSSKYSTWTKSLYFHGYSNPIARKSGDLFSVNWQEILGSAGFRFFSSQLSNLTMYLYFASLSSNHPGFLPQTHQVHILTRTMAFAPVYLKRGSFRPWRAFLSNIQVTSSARLTHLEHVPLPCSPCHLPL